MLLQSPVVDTMVYSDLADGPYNFLCMLRDHREELLRLISLTPWSSTEHAIAKAGFPENGKGETLAERLEQARQFYALAWMSFSGLRPGNIPGFKRSTGMSHRMKHLNDVSDLEEIARLIVSRWVLENRNVLDLFESWDSKVTLWYLDPPYIVDTRAKGGKGAYAHEMETEEEHRAFLERVLELKGMAAISHYDHPLYNDILRGWPKYKIEARTGNPLASANRIECVWLSPHASMSQSSMFGAFGMEVAA
jgi:DNA adenine methylase